MKCVCRIKCQVRDEYGKIWTYRKGDVAEFEKCPTHFDPIEGEEAVPLNFETAQEQELLESDFDIEKLKEYILEKYGKKTGTRGKEKIIEMLMDCRFRDLGDLDVNKVL